VLTVLLDFAVRAVDLLKEVFSSLSSLFSIHLL
jgi:hypothetical protein